MGFIMNHRPPWGEPVSIRSMSIEQIKELRDRTNVSLDQCRTALVEANGNLDEAIVVLQKRGTLRAGAVADRSTGHGQIFTYNHNGRVAGMVIVACETDFAAKSEPFVKFGEDLAMQVVGISTTQYLRREEIPVDLWAQQMSIFAESSRLVGMPEERLNKIVDGKMKKWVSEVCLLDQESVTTPKKTIEELRVALIAKLGENIVITRFACWKLS